jgi:hypothetical protein
MLQMQIHSVELESRGLGLRHAICDDTVSKSCKNLTMEMLSTSRHYDVRKTDRLHDVQSDEKNGDVWMCESVPSN